MGKTNLQNLLILGVLILSFSDCSLDYDEVRVAEDISAETPETVLNNFKHTVVRAGKVAFILQAKRAEEYGIKKRIVLKDVHFQEFDEEGSLLIEGWADRAVFNTETEDADLSGSIYIYSYADENSLTAKHLSWTREGKILEAGPQEPVQLRRDDGSFVEGLGFRADFRRKKLEFSSEVKGSYVREEED